MAYKCNSCTYTTNIKTNIVRHIKRNHPKVSNEDGFERISVAPSFECRHGCGATYAHQSNRCVHEKKCKSRLNTTPSDPTTASTITDSTVQSIVGDNNVCGNNNNVQHNNIQITINAFDTFNPESISHADFRSLLISKGATDALVTHLQNQQFDKKKPQNMNVFVSNLKDKVGRVYDGHRWKACDGEEVAEDVLAKYQSVFDTLCDEVDESEDVSFVNRMTKAIEKWRRQTGHPTFDDNAKKSIIWTLYNLSEIVKDTHKITSKGTPKNTCK